MFEVTFLTSLPYVDAWGSTQVSLFTSRSVRMENDHATVGCAESVPAWCTLSSMGMDERNRKILRAQASRETKKALDSAMRGLVHMQEIETANPGIGYVQPSQKQKAELKKFVYDYRNSWINETPVKGIKKKGK